jgi:signal transduction histidine kinase
LNIRFKITLLFTVLVTAILVVLNLSVYYLTSRDVNDVFLKRLKSRASSNAQIYDFFGDTSTTVLYRIDGGSLAMLPRKSVVIFDLLGHQLYHYVADNADSLTINPEVLNEIREKGEATFKQGERDAFGTYYRGSKEFMVIVAADNEDGRLRLEELKKVMLVSMLVAIIVTLLTGLIFSSQLVKPISSIIRDVNAISSHNLSKRLPSGNSHDELNQLILTFNELLDRLQDSFNTQRRFISNASHELSTPLTSILSQLQVTFQKERNIEEYKRVMLSIQEDVEQLRQLTKSLLEIAKAGSQGSIELTELRVDELVMKLVSDVKRINENYEVNFTIDEIPEDEKSLNVFGNYDLLYSALKNIIENGCKYSPDSTSRVELAFDQNDIHIRVMNKGDVINEQEIEQIFQPFFRGENVGETRGFGLGLSLARRLIALHKGHISVKSDQEGTLFTIVLPSAAK